MYAFVVDPKYLGKLVKIRQETGLPISKQIRQSIEDFLYEYEGSNSEFMKSLGKFRKPRIGEILKTEHGRAKISGIRTYDEVVEEMRNNGVSGEEIDHFDLRVENFLGRKNRYFECELTYADGDVDCIDWSEYLALRNRDKR